MLSAVGLLAVCWALWKIHAAWGRSELRQIEMQSAGEIWDDITEHERRDQLADHAARSLQRSGPSRH